MGLTGQTPWFAVGEVVIYGTGIMEAYNACVATALKMSSLCIQCCVQLDRPRHIRFPPLRPSCGFPTARDRSWWTCLVACERLEASSWVRACPHSGQAAHPGQNSMRLAGQDTLMMTRAMAPCKTSSVCNVGEAIARCSKVQVAAIAGSWRASSTRGVSTGAAVNKISVCDMIR